jgi:hypothetical protein
MNTTASPPEKAVQNLAVIASVVEAYRLVFSNLRVVPATICMPALIYAVWYLVQKFSGMSEFVVGVENSPEELSQLPVTQIFAIGIISFVVQAFATSLLYVAWHRFVLLGPVEGQPKFIYAPERRHLRFLGNTLLVVLIVFAGVVILSVPMFLFLAVLGTLFQTSSGIVSVVAGLLIMVIYVGLLTRFSFVFPAISVDEKYGLRNAWKQSRGQEIRLIAGFFLSFLPSLVISLIINWRIFGQLLTGEEVQIVGASVWFSVAMYAIGVLNGLVVISFLSIAFKTCTGWVAEIPVDRGIQLRPS